MTEETEDGAARAFEALRAEIAGLRKEWEKHAPVDYSVSLAEILGVLKVIDGRVDKMEQHPALRMTPAMHEQLIRDAGRIAMSGPVERINDIVRRGALARDQLEGIVGRSRTRRAQLKWVATTAGVALVVGLVGAPFAARGLPKALQSRVAALVMEKDRWEAGKELMGLQSPKAVREIFWATQFVEANRVTIEVCRKAAVKSRNAKRCKLVVALP